MNRKTALLLALFAFSSSAFAFSPLQIGVGSNLQLVSTNTPVIGLRLNLLYSQNETVGGLDLGFVSSSQNLSGIGLNAVSFTEGTLNGISIGLLGTSADTVNGIQLAPIAWARFVRGIQAGLFPIAYGLGESFCGVQIGFCNFAEDLRGVQVGIFNNGNRFMHDTGCVHGLQLGLFNFTPALYGVQIGILNFAENLHGVQIGILNYDTGDHFPIPLLRAAF